MKAKRDHRLPLSRIALEILQEAHGLWSKAGLEFPSEHGRAISDNTASKLLRDLGIEALPHGYRSSFREWAAECVDAPGEVCELTLAHVNSDGVEATSGGSSGLKKPAAPYFSICREKTWCLPDLLNSLIR